MAGIIGRRMMERDVTFTKVKVAKIEVKNGVQTLVTLPDEVIIGNANLEQAQRIVNKRYGEPIVVLERHANTETYELAVEDFVKYGRVKNK